MAQISKILVKGGRVFDGEKFLYADVLTEGDKIAKIAPGISDAADFVFDATGMTVAPGLVDLHVHMRGISSEIFGINAEMSSIPFGVTSAADASGKHGDKALLETFLVKGLVFSAVVIKNNHADFTETEKSLSRFGKRAVGIKVYFDTAHPEVRDVTPLKEACEFAHARGLSVMVHCTGSPSPMSEILDTLGKGDILTHAFHGGKNNALEDNFESLFSAQKRGIFIDCGFAGHVHTNFEIFRSAIKCGFVPDTISTDITKLSAYKRGGRYGMTTCMSIARCAGLGEEQIFKCVTSNAARALGKEEIWGRLHVGGAADLSVFDYTDEGFDLIGKENNRMKSDTGYRCMLTVVDGNVVYRR